METERHTSKQGTGPTRRAFVQAAVAGPLLACQKGLTMEPTDAKPTVGRRAPVAFLSHGAPTLALDEEKAGDFRRWAKALRRPSAVLVVSAHWEETPLVVGTTRPERLVYDFSGFDRRLYERKYDAPGAPELAERVSELLGGPTQRARRMWDHGVWVPLFCMYPDAEVPVLQVSLPSRAKPSELYGVGRSLRALRDENVLLLASGGMVHNLMRIDWSERGSPPDWATSFEGWIREVLAERDHGKLRAFEREAPALREAHPTLEHFLPLLVAAGASFDEDSISFPIEGYEYGSLSRTAVQFG